LLRTLIKYRLLTTLRILTIFKGYEELSTNLETYSNAHLTENGLDYTTKQNRISSHRFGHFY